MPLLQERGVLRTEYTTTTLRDHLGLPPAGTMPANAPPPPPALKTASCRAVTRS